jgi:putative MFS transporter
VPLDTAQLSYETVVSKSGCSSATDKVTCLLSAASNSMVSLMLLRGLFGFGIGGAIPSVIALLMESSPPEAAASSLGFTQCLFALGGVFVTAIASAVLSQFGWQVLVLIAAVPLFICVPFYIPGYILESPVWLNEAGRTDEAQDVVATIRSINGHPPPPAPPPAPAPAPPPAKSSSRLGSFFSTTPTPAVELEKPLAPSAGASDGSSGAGGVRKAAFIDQLRGVFVVHGRTSLVLMPLWALMSFGYYGLVFVLPTFLNQHMPHEEEYVGVLLTAIAEIPGYLLGGWLADRIGRRAVLTWSFGASAVMAFVTGAAAWAMESADVGWGWTLVLACVLKTALSSAFLVIMVYTTEAYPTLLTTTSYGFGNAFTRLAGAITPSVGQVLLDSTSSFTTFAVYGIGCALATVLAALLPFETKGRDADAIERARPLSEATPLQPKGAAVA